MRTLGYLASGLLLLWSCGQTLTAVASPPSAGNPPLHITVLNPAEEGHPFWDMLIGFMQEAAADLNVELEILYGNSNRFRTTEQARAVLQRTDKPDYLLFNYFFSQGSHILQAAEKAGVYSVIFNTDIPQTEATATGRPGQHYQYWIGRIVPDEQQAGYDLAMQLRREGTQRGFQDDLQQLQIIAISGMRDATATTLRNQGLLDAVSEHPDLHLQQLLFANWSADTAATQAAALLQRYPRARLIWSASDAMALAALQSAAARQLTPGEQVLAVGFDWTTDALQAIRDGRLLASAGGHFLDGALALAFVYDHAHGHGLPAREADITRRMDLINAENINRYQRLLDRRNWPAMDFRLLTRTHGKRAGVYEYDTKQVADILLAD